MNFVCFAYVVCYCCLYCQLSVTIEMINDFLTDFLREGPVEPGTEAVMGPSMVTRRHRRRGGRGRRRVPPISNEFFSCLGGHKSGCGRPRSFAAAATATSSARGPAVHCTAGTPADTSFSVAGNMGAAANHDYTPTSYAINNILSASRAYQGVHPDPCTGATPRIYS